MSRADTHVIRSRRSSHGTLAYHPVYKAMANKEHKRRQTINRMLAKMYPNATREKAGRSKAREQTTAK